jgi:NHL repeat
MKCFFSFFLAATAAFGADFITGQAARAIIGQSQFTRAQEGAGKDLVGGVGGLAYANDTLFVTDANRVGSVPVNHRVLLFKNLSNSLPAPTDELFYSRRCPVCVGEASVVLGQTDFTKTEFRRTQSGLRLPTAVATDGRYLAVADTDNNRVLIWNSIPSSNNAPADVVVGQSSFEGPNAGLPGTTASTMRGPQGVWIQNGRLFVADTQNHRVLIFNSIPTTNGAAANVVLGQPNLTTAIEPDLTQSREGAKANNLLNPVSATSDGQRLYVSDLGHNRVLIWNSIPTSNQTPADVVLGQPDFTSATPNNSTKLCPVTGKKDADGNDTYPKQCQATLDFPRFALSDGQRLFIADGGNDRVLVYSSVPAENGARANHVLGQLGGEINQANDAADSLRTPLSLAWDGTNLYVSDAFNRRITVYSPAENSIPYTGVRNAASREIFAVGSVTVGGTIKTDDEITISIGPEADRKQYKYKVIADDTFANIVQRLSAAINEGAGDPRAFATPNAALPAVILTARSPGSDGNLVEYTATVSTAAATAATTTATTGGATFAGGQDAASIAPGTLVAILGDNLAATTASVPAGVEELPTELAGVQVYFDGIRAHLLFVSPTQINAQIPFEVLDTTSLNAFVRTRRPDGTVTVTTPVSVTIVQQNPGIFAGDGPDPRPAVAFHFSDRATGTVSIDGSIKAGDIATVVIEDRSYSYTIKTGDTREIVRDELIKLINEDPVVEAFPASVFTRIRLRARQPGGNGIIYAGRASDGAEIAVTNTTASFCCANTAGGRITEDNPAQPGETIVIYATGLGIPEPPVEVDTGRAFRGPVNIPREFVSSLAGGRTANVLFAGLKQGSIGIWEVHLELNTELPTNPQTQLTIAQFTFVSNIVTVPVFNPNPPAVQ